MRVAIVMGLMLLAVSLQAGEVPGVDVVAEAKAHVHDYSLSPPDSIAGVIEKSLANVTTAPELFAILGERFGLTDETARLIGMAALRNVIAEGGGLAANETERDEVLRTLDALYAAALRSDRSNAAVAREYLVLLAGDDNHDPDAPKRIREVLGGLARDQRGIVALQVLSDLRVAHLNATLLEAAAESAGLNPLLLAIVADEIASSDNAELFERASEVWLAQKDVESASAAAVRAIYSYGNRRSVTDVLRIYRHLPAEAKAIVIAAPADEATVRSHGIERRIGSRDIRLTLAAAFVLSGDPRAALPLLPEPTPAGDARLAKVQNESLAAMKNVLLAAIEPPPGDAFDLVTKYLEQANEKSTGLVDEVFERVATRTGYEAAAKWRLEGLDRGEEMLRRQAHVALPKAIAALMPTRMAPIAAAASPRMMRFLKPERLSPFVERPVDDNARVAPSRCDVLAELRGRGLAFPQGFEPLRAEAKGDEIVAVAASQDVDPVGEISMGGYWIIHSTDRGATWLTLYTGLRADQPYEVVIGSTLPLMMSGGVRVEVVVNEIDEASITFPPVALTTKRTKEGIALDFKWRDLERDSDHDGLTDLLEERILTNPNDGDTDSDGVPDALDPLPQVAFHRSSGDVAEVVAAVFDAYYGPSPRLHPGAVIEKANNERTIFLAGDPADFAGVSTAQRIIVGSETDFAAASAKFGLMLATHISPVIIDRTGTRAWVEINDAWRGATYRLEKRNGVWIAQVVGSWVT